jgi:two-component system NtrC family response regulator
MLRAAPPSAVLPAAPEEEAETLIGASPAMRQVQKVIGLVADSDATVLVTGETGTGKELVARAIHEHGRRSGGPFVAVNCAAIPPELLESELFGHAKGAFTGAVAERAGAFRDAARGTLFLDEIGDMPLAMQAKILRALQERTVQPVGGRPVRLDVRIVAATHRDLAAAVREGGFRQDLYYRLNVVPIHLPPLRERRDDILPLARHFLRRAVAGRSPPDLAADAQDLLLRHPWPGNVRELRNAMERVAVLCRAEAVTAADLDFLAGGGTYVPGDEEAPDLPTAVARLEARLIGRALREAGGNRAEAARRLGIHRQLLYAKARRYGLLGPDPSGERTPPVANGDSDGGDGPADERE